MKIFKRFLKAALLIILAFFTIESGFIVIKAEEEITATIIINQDEIVFIQPTESYQLDVEITGVEEPYELEWSSDNEEIATVDHEGFLYAVNPGTAIITVRVSEELSGTCIVIVEENALPDSLEEIAGGLALTKPGKINHLRITNIGVTDPYTQLLITYDLASNATAYQIYRANKQKGSYKLIDTIPGDSYTDSHLLADSTYYYKVRAINVSGSDVKVGDSSAVVHATTAKFVIGKVSGLKVTKTYSTTADITFNNLSGVDGYRIYRATKKKGSYKLTATVTANNYLSTGLTNRKKYYYKVRAYVLHDGNYYYGAYSDRFLVKTNRIVTYKSNYNADKVYDHIKKLAKTFPDLIDYQGSIGLSVKNKEIHYFTIGHGSDEALLVGGMHAREHLGTNYILRMIEDYAVAYTNNNSYNGYDLKTLFAKYTIYVVPNCNPDGLNIVTKKAKSAIKCGLNGGTRPWFRNNANGVNLNRNFDYHWASGKKASKVSKPDCYTYYGNSAASEPETRALVDICNTHNFKFMFSIHHVGNIVYYGNPTNLARTKDKNGNHYGLAKALVDHAGFKFANIAKMPLTLYAGCFEDWFTDTFFRPGFCVELVPSGQRIRPTSKKGNKHFNRLTNWKKSRNLLAAAMKYEMK